MYFTYKGIPSYQMGITVTKRPTFTVAAQQLSTYDTPGIDGILVENEGKHSIVIQMDIVIDNMDMFDDINGWLTGKGRFTRSDYPDRYMEVEVQSGLFNQFVGSTYYQTPISFYAYDPYWYPTENVDRAFRNLIKADFSDFTAFQGATVTRNKTFPIDTFKGGRNLLKGTDFSNSSNLNNSWAKPLNILKDDLYPYIRYSYDWDFQNVDITLPSGEYIISLMGKRDIPNVSTGQIRLGFEGFVGEGVSATVLLGQSTDNWVKYYHKFKLTEDSTNGKIRFLANGGSEFIRFATIKLEKGDTLTEWSPAPEDGYDYTGSDGAYHIQTSGGTDLQKFFNSTIPLTSDFLTSQVDVYSFNSSLIVRMNGINPPTPIEFAKRKLVTIQDQRPNGYKQLQFVAQAIPDSLDFIASDPFITDFVLEEWLPVTNEIVNSGTTASKPILRITRGDNGTADLTVNGTRFLYFFQGTSVGVQVEIDFNLRTAKEGDTLTTPNLMIGYAYPIVDVGKNKVINKGNHKLEIRRESRYL